MSVLESSESLAEKVDRFFESKKAHGFIVSLVFINAIIFGLDAMPSVKAAYESWLKLGDQIILSIFIVELMSRVIVTRSLFFKDYWNVFDLLVTIVSVLPLGYNFSGLRVLRVLHCLRFLELFPKTKHLIDGLAHSIYGIINTVFLTCVFFYVFTLMSVDIFGVVAPELFGDLPTASFSLFGFMISPQWKDLADLAQVCQHTWLFFGVFVFVMSYFLLNLIIGVVVGALAKAEEENEQADKPSPMENSLIMLSQEVLKLQDQVNKLRKELAGK